MNKELLGPKYKPKNGKTETICIFLHGWGSDGNDLIGLADVLANSFENMLFLSPHAPDICDMNPSGRQWFDIYNREQNDDEIDKPNVFVEKYIEKNSLENNVPKNKIFLFGFSQGAMVALHVGLRLKVSLGGILSFSGSLLVPERIKEIKNKTPVLMVHGKKDDVVPYSELDKGEEHLKNEGIKVDKLSVPELGHGIDQTGISKAIEFMNYNLKNVI